VDGKERVGGVMAATGSQKRGSSPAKAGAQPDMNARGSAFGALRRDWTPAFAGEQEKLRG
jgi:hypothetical protein